MSFYGTHPDDYAAAIDKLQLGTSMRNTKFPGSDTDAYANPRDEGEHICSMPLDNNAFQWTRDPQTYTVSHTGDRAFSMEQPLTNVPYQYLNALRAYSGPSFTPSNEFKTIDFATYNSKDDSYKYLNHKPFCQVGVELKPWQAAVGKTGDENTTFSARFAAYDGACYPPPRCGC